MSLKIVIPEVGDGEFPIIEMLVNVGDTVQKEDSLMVLESDKATLEVPAPADGVISALSVKVDDKVSSGSEVGEMEVAADEVTSVEEPAETTKPEPEAAPVEKGVKEEKTEQSVPKEVSKSVASQQTSSVAVFDETSFKTAYASPSVRLFARELGVDLGKVSGSGRKNRITRDDVAGFVKIALQGGGIASTPVSTGAGIPATPVVDFSKFGEIEEQTLTRINVLTGQYLSAAWLNIPHVTQFDEADITDLEDFRKSLKAEAEKIGVRVTMLAFIMKAVAAGLKAFPRFNSSLSPSLDALIMKKYYHLGIAVDTPNGLVVPVIRDVDKKSIYDLSAELMEVSKKARDGKLKPTDMQGGCMTISSLGGIGGTAFTPIVNAPEVAILGVSRSAMKPVWNGKEFSPRNMLPLSLSYDHRVIDGADGARFSQYLVSVLSDARRLLL